MKVALFITRYELIRERERERERERREYAEFLRVRQTFFHITPSFSCIRIFQIYTKVRKK